MLIENLEYISIENQTTHFPKHFHETFCVSLIHQGLEQIDFENHSLFSEKGCISITNPYEIHSNPISDSEIPLRFDTLYLPIDLMRYVLNGRSIRFFNRKINNVLANMLFSKLKVAIDSRNSKQIELSLTYFLNVLQNYSSEYEMGFWGIDFEEFNDINLYVENNIQDKFTLNDLAKMANINKYGFAKKFKNFTGMSPMNYILMKKAFSSKKLISQHSELTEIAYQYNFSDLAHFSKTFKRFIGISPRNYRDSLRSN